VLGYNIDNTLFGVDEVLEAVLCIVIASSVSDYEDRRILAVQSTLASGGAKPQTTHVVDYSGVAKGRQVC